MTLTPRQKEVLDFIRDYRRDIGYSPKLEEIARFMCVSKVTIHGMVRTMVGKGVLTHKQYKSRSLVPVEDSDARLRAWCQSAREALLRGHHVKLVSQLDAILADKGLAGGAA